MAENEGGVKFVCCIGSDIHLWKKRPNDVTFEWETCLLFDEPEYHIDGSEFINTTWKFIDHITKRYLLGNGKKEFHYQKYECPPIRIEIKTPLYTLKELCTFTIATRLLFNNNAMAVHDFEIPKELKIDLKECLENIAKMYEQDGDCFINDWTVRHEEEYGF